MRLRGPNGKARAVRLGEISAAREGKTHDPRGRPRVLPHGAGGYVYFAQAGEDGPIKIGWTCSPQERIDALQTSSPFKLNVLVVLEGSKKDEAAFHRQFADHRLNGEWFTDCDEIREEIRSRVAAAVRPAIHGGERCLNCLTQLVLGEDFLCKACIEFMDCWATPKFKKLWRKAHAA